MDATRQSLEQSSKLEDAYSDLIFAEFDENIKLESTNSDNKINHNPKQCDRCQKTKDDP